MSMKSIEHLLDISNDIGNFELFSNVYLERPKFVFSGQNKLKPIDSRIQIKANPIKQVKPIKKLEVQKPADQKKLQQKSSNKVLPKLEKKQSIEQETEQLKKDVWRPSKYLEELANIGDFEDYINQDNEEREQIAKRLEIVLQQKQNQELNTNISKKVRECKLKNDNPFELPINKQQKLAKQSVMQNQKKVESKGIAQSSKKIKKVSKQQPLAKTPQVPLIKRPISFIKPVYKSVNKPVHKLVNKPIHKPVNKPVNKPANKPVNKPILKAVIPETKTQKKEENNKEQKEQKIKGKANSAQITWYCFRCEKYHEKDLHKKQKEEKLKNQLLNKEKENIEKIEKEKINNKIKEEYNNEYDDDYDKDSFIDDDDDRYLQEDDIVQREMQKLQKLKRGINYNKMDLEDESDNMEAGFDEIEEEERYSKYVGMKEDERELKYIQKQEMRHKNKNKL